jgi:DNA repair protein RecN (Recombination protein N)
MLAQLNIRNFAIIDELQVTFAGGLNMISGETGAGKSIIIGAVGLLLGDRANADMIRSYEDSAVVEALFDIQGQEGLRAKIHAMGYGDGEELVVRRVVSRSGKNRVFINGNLASLGALAAIGESLINICGQHEHQMILAAENHTDILDEFGALGPLRAAYQEIHGHYRGLEESLRGMRERRKARQEREELLRFQIDELDRAGLAAGEDQALAEERRILANVLKLMDLANGAHEILYGRAGSVLAELKGAIVAVREIRKIDPGLKLSDAELEELYYRLEEAAYALRDYAGGLCPDPARQEAVEERLELLGRLKRKYGGTVEAALERLYDARREIGELSALGERTEELNRQIAAERDRLLDAARSLSAGRRRAAVALEKAVEAEIRTLRMEQARFSVVFGDPPPGQEPSLGEKGTDILEFYLSANAGEELKPLRSIASGGELSRIMLALKKVLARTGSVGTIVFDEVDSGIGGATAQIVGQKLLEVARHHQVLCITHLPQIASFGDRHYRVVKRVVGERTQTSVFLLTAEERTEEIARMLGGVELTQKTKDHAREMLQAARG